MSASTLALVAPATANSSFLKPPATPPPSALSSPPISPPANSPSSASAKRSTNTLLDHRNGQWFIRTNDRGRNFRLVTAPVDAPSHANWVERIPHRDTVMLEDIDLFANFFVACEREDGLPRLRLWKFQNPSPDQNPEANPYGEIAFPEPAYSASPGINRIWETTTFRYGYQSLVTPASVYEYDMDTRESALLKQQEVPGGFDRTLYASERIFATAADGVQVPVSIVYRRDKFAKNTKSPLYVYGYGSYGYSLPLGFNSNRLSLLDRGIVIAYAHIRGGGDIGKPWHDAGQMLMKRNTFTDFISVVEHLTANGYGDPRQSSHRGRLRWRTSHGRRLQLRPDLFRAVLSHVPFVDVMNTMLDASLPLTVPEYEEWGNPERGDPLQVHVAATRPYDNLKAVAIPRCWSKHRSTTARSCTGSPQNT